MAVFTQLSLWLISLALLAKSVQATDDAVPAVPEQQSGEEHGAETVALQLGKDNNPVVADDIPDHKRPDGQTGKKLQTLAGLQDYHTGHELLAAHQDAVRIAEKDIQNPLGNFHVHLWAYLHSLPAKFCVVSQEVAKTIEIVKNETLPPKDALTLFEEVLVMIEKEKEKVVPWPVPGPHPIDKPLIKHATDILHPHTQLRNCCKEYFVYIDIKHTEPWKPSKQFEYVQSKTAAKFPEHTAAVHEATANTEPEPEPVGPAGDGVGEGAEGSTVPEPQQEAEQQAEAAAVEQQHEAEQPVEQPQEAAAEEHHEAEQPVEAAAGHEGGGEEAAQQREEHKDGEPPKRRRRRLQSGRA